MDVVATVSGLPSGVSSVEQLVFFEDRLLAGRYLTLSIFTVLVLEYLFTFDQEVKYIWQSKPLFAWTKLLFVAVRYLPLMTSFVRLYVVMQPSIDPSVYAYAATPFPDSVLTRYFNRCVSGIAFTAWTGVFSSAAVEIVLMLRIWALYGRSRTVAIFFVAITSVGIAGALVILQVKPQEIPTFIAPVAPSSLTTCMHGNPVQHPLLFTLLACIELCLFWMLVRKAAFAIFAPKQAAPVVANLIEDGAVYFACVFLCLILAALAPFMPYLAQPVMDSEFTVGVGAAACVRLIFSLKGAVLGNGDNDDSEDGDESRRPSVSMAFSDPIPMKARFSGSERSRSMSTSRSFKRIVDGDEEWEAGYFEVRPQLLHPEDGSLRSPAPLLDRRDSNV